MLDRIHRRRRLLAGASCLLALAAAPRASGETLRYRLEVPDQRSVTYRLEFEVRHAGPLAVEAEWTGERTLALRLEPPSGSPFETLRRSGPSPLRLETIVEREDGERLGVWKLQLHALPADGDATGTLTVELAGAREATVPAPEPAAPAPAAPPAWLEPRGIPPDLPAPWRPFFESVERLRAELATTAEDAPADRCRWQSGLMRYLAEHRDRLLEHGAPPERTTRTVLGKIAAAVDTVERLRTSADPLLAGPPPEDPALEDAWLKLRTSRIRAIEDELDTALSLVRRGYAPELSGEDWPVRLVSCLTACQRFFDERARVGEERAVNREVAREQWTRIRLAGGALRALTLLP